MENKTVTKPNKLGGKTWLSILLFGLLGQLAWVVENMYFSTFIQKNITTAGWATSATVAASAVTAAVVTVFGGVLTDRVGKRKPFMCFGYILWGLVTASFAFFGNERISGEAVVTATVVFVIMDCVMTFFGNISNDAAYSAWITDVTDISNRGFVDVVLSILPVAALLIIFVGFDGMTQDGNWTLFFMSLGLATAVAGVIGLFILKDSKDLKPDRSGKYLQEVAYGFRPESIKNHKMIYICLIGMMLSGLSMQLWQPYMIMILQYTLGFGSGFVVPLAVVILISAVLAVLGGKFMDKYGKEKFFYPVTAAGVLGGLLAYGAKFVEGDSAWTFVLFVLGGTLVETASLMAAGLFNATARDYTPAEKAGCFQGVRIVIYVMLPMIIASLACPFLIKTFGPVVTAFDVPPSSGYHAIPAGSGYQIGDHIYPFELFLFAGLVAVLLFVPACIVKRENNKLRTEKLKELEK